MSKSDWCRINILRNTIEITFVGSHINWDFSQKKILNYTSVLVLNIGTVK